MLSVERLSFSYTPDRPVLRDVSFTLREGELLSVLGPNGVGKSTLFKCILGSLPDYSGEVLLGGREIRSLSGRERSALTAYIPQIHRPSFAYSVLDVALMGTARQFSVFAAPGEEQLRRTREALERVGAGSLEKRNFSELSGGEQQLVLIARALAQSARLLIMDEPTSALDYGNQYRILRLVRELTGEGYSVLLSTHNPQHALFFSDRLLALSDGAVAAFGNTREVFTPELIRTLYGIDILLADTPAGVVPVPVGCGREILP